MKNLDLLLFRVTYSAQPDLRLSYAQHIARGRAGADRELSRSRSYSRQSYRRLGDAVWDGDMGMEKSVGSTITRTRSVGRDRSHLQGDEPTSDKRCSGPGSVPPGTGQAASRRPREPRHRDERLRIVEDEL